MLPQVLGWLMGIAILIAMMAYALIIIDDVLAL